MLRWLWIFLVFSLVACGPGKQELELYGVDISDRELDGAFTLTDHQGQVRRLEDFKGKVVVLFFGYTHCPDVCPTTMLSLANAMKLMGDKAQDVQVLFVSVDPERDTREVLAQYVPFFDARFIGLNGTPEQLKRVAKNYKVVYAKRPAEDGDAYTVDHSTGVYVVDREGKVRAYLRHDETPEQLAHDITQFF
ncbi:SCO family protein [Methylobacillus sp. Pita2]|uniref:SCO family protein n=1 Tax=unclassified Methylobacillus TaxID=2647660 RepID=UPI0038B5DB96